MIVSNLIGGLGNQLFQFACGHAVAQRHGVPLQVAVDQFAGYTLHQGYELQRVFTVDAPVADDAALRECLGLWRRPLMRGVLEKLRPGVSRSGRVAFEPAGNFWPGIDGVGPDAYLHGYWQSERYFEAAGQTLVQQLRFRQPTSAENARWLDRIAEGTSSVSVHVRRGDYISNPKNRGIYAECTAAYYRAALDHIRQAHSGVRCFVFSDDIAWAREALAEYADAAAFIDHNRGAESYNDLRLMSHCQHHVIANSTFSWWAAWLGEHTQQRANKIIVAPQRWYVQPGRGVDLVPARWTRL